MTFFSIYLKQYSRYSPAKREIRREFQTLLGDIEFWRKIDHNECGKNIDNEIKIY